MTTTDEQMNELLEEFRDRREQRWDEGAAEYGETAWLKNNMIDFALEEILDAVNYLERMYVKLRLVQRGLLGQGVEE